MQYFEPLSGKDRAALLKARWSRGQPPFGIIRNDSELDAAIDELRRTHHYRVDLDCNDLASEIYDHYVLAGSLECRSDDEYVPAVLMSAVARWHQRQLNGGGPAVEARLDALRCLQQLLDPLEVLADETPWLTPAIAQLVAQLDPVDYATFVRLFECHGGRVWRLLRATAATAGIELEEAAS
jgi:hypothetical protein